MGDGMNTLGGVVHSISRKEFVAYMLSVTGGSVFLMKFSKAVIPLKHRRLLKQGATFYLEFVNGPISKYRVSWIEGT